MSLSADRRRRNHEDEGFALIEIMVALGILMVVMVAMLPQLVIGIRSSDTAAGITRAKGVAQGQLERMRNMPYHVARQSGPYLDVLDRYYTDRTAPGAITCKQGAKYVAPTTGWSGYVDGAARCDYEPATGAFYRYVVPHPSSGTDPNEGFQVVVDTQFLDGATPPAPVAAPSGYNTQTAGSDRPPASQIGVTVTVLYSRHGSLRPVTTYTQIADLPEEVSRVKVTADARAVEIGSVLDAQGAVSLEAGLLDLSGSLAFASEAGADVAAVSAGLATGEQDAGAAATLTAPSAAGTALGSPGCLLALACWGNTQVDPGPTSASGGLPTVGSPTTPVQARLTSAELSFHNGAPSDYRPKLGIDGPLVRVAGTATPAASGVTSTCTPGSGGSAYVRSTGYLTTTAASTVEACALSSATTMALFPTTFAPNGVVQVDLVRASARCVVSGVGHTAQAPVVDYQAVVRYHVGTDPNTYQTAATITSATATDLLAAAPLSVDVDGTAGDRTLGDYVASWSNLDSDDIERTSTGGVSSVRLPGVVHVTSVPMRGTETTPTPDPTPTPTPSPSPTADPSATADPSGTTSPSATTSPSPTESPSPTVEPVETVDPTSAFTFTAGLVGCSAQDAR